MEKTEKTTQVAVIKVRKEYLSREDLRAMAVGQSIEFVMPSSKLESASSACNNMRYEGKKFTKSIHIDDNPEESSITVTRTK
jgi:hypothetical protein